ncbi:MAG TPA: hypothetical protein VJQ06_05260 [Rhizomicrobium sp.]|nr:hypothetical protein [Rhizomicrobium sp.]
MFKKTLVGLLCCVSTATAAAWPKDMCPTGADGLWVVVSTHPYSDITALSWDEAHAYIGKKVFVSDRKVIYAGVQCEVVKKSIENISKMPTFDPSLDVFDPKFPYSIGYGCRDNVFVFGFGIGRSCDRITSGGDGWTFDLRRVKTK